MKGNRDLTLRLRERRCERREAVDVRRLLAKSLPGEIALLDRVIETIFPHRCQPKSVSPVYRINRGDAVIKILQMSHIFDCDFAVFSHITVFFIPKQAVFPVNGRRLHRVLLSGKQDIDAHVDVLARNQFPGSIKCHMCIGIQAVKIHTRCRNIIEDHIIVMPREIRRRPGIRAVRFF